MKKSNKMFAFFQVDPEPKQEEKESEAAEDPDEVVKEKEGYTTIYDRFGKAIRNVKKDEVEQKN